MIYIKAPEVLQLENRVIRANSGFTLIELMIVVAIVGILVSLALMNFRIYQCKTKQLEAKTGLGKIRINEEAYFAAYDRYSSSMAKIGFATRGDTRYDYFISSSVESFTASASAIIYGDMDTWTIDQNGILTNMANACS